MRHRFADEAGSLAAVETKDALLKDPLARAAPCVNFSKQHPRQGEEVLTGARCCSFVLCRDELPEGDALRADVIPTDFPKYDNLGALMFIMCSVYVGGWVGVGACSAER